MTYNHFLKQLFASIVSLSPWISWTRILLILKNNIQEILWKKNEKKRKENKCIFQTPWISSSMFFLACCEKRSPLLQLLIDSCNNKFHRKVVNPKLFTRISLRVTRCSLVAELFLSPTSSHVPSPGLPSVYLSYQLLRRKYYAQNPWL